jgi:hypothetical protein
VNEYVVVNGIRVPVIKNMRDLESKIKGLRQGSILIISYNCIITEEAKAYIESRGIKLVKMD